MNFSVATGVPASRCNQSSRRDKQLRGSRASLFINVAVRLGCNGANKNIGCTLFVQRALVTE
jgi:hypothetical protein